MTAMSQGSAQSSPLISEGYRELQRKLHENADYGVASVHYAPLVADILIQQPPSWWLLKLLERFELVTFNRMPMGFWVGVERKHVL